MKENRDDVKAPLRVTAKVCGPGHTRRAIAIVAGPNPESPAMNAKPLAFAAIALAVFATAHAAGPKPAPELQKAIDAFAGSWTIEEEYPPSPDLPKGGTGHG